MTCWHIFDEGDIKRPNGEQDEEKVDTRSTTLLSQHWFRKQHPAQRSESVGVGDKAKSMFIAGIELQTRVAKVFDSAMLLLHLVVRNSARPAM